MSKVNAVNFFWVAFNILLIEYFWSILDEFDDPDLERHLVGDYDIDGNDDYGDDHYDGLYQKAGKWVLSFGKLLV